MKKLILAAAIVCAAAMSHAASVDWGGAFATVDNTKVLPTGTQFALVFSTEALGSVTRIEAFSKGVEVGTGSIVDVYSTSEYDTECWSFRTTWSRDGQDVNGYYAILCLNDAGDYAAFTDMGAITGTTATSSSSYLVYNEGWCNGLDEWLTSGGYTVQVGGAASIPEPTSGLLMLIGMGAMALRRKRA